MILLDTGPLVALVDPRDQLHDQAVQDLASLARRPLLLNVAVLTETLFHLPLAVQRTKLRRLIRELDVRFGEIDPTTVEAAWNWMKKYADHEPDFADAVLCVLVQQHARSKVWTYDREFASVWRRPDGRKIAMANRQG